VRRAILDADGDGHFDALDLALFADHLFPNGQPAAPTAPDYGRYDLNGDGYTGGEGFLMSAPFDLDRRGSQQYRQDDGDFTTVTQNISGVDVTFDENHVTDAEILCYYAYSALFSESADARDFALEPRHCLDPKIEVDFPGEVSPAADSTLTVRVTNQSLQGVGGGATPMPGLVVELEPTGGSVAAASGTTNADGVFQTTARPFVGETDLWVEIVVRAREGGPELAREIAVGYVPCRDRFPGPPQHLVARVRPYSFLSVVSLRTDDGLSVTGLALYAGAYDITVHDDSTRDNFDLRRSFLLRRTSISGTGTQEWHVCLYAGTYKFLSDSDVRTRKYFTVVDRPD